MTSKDALSIGTDVKPPVLFKGEYEQWKDRFLDFIDRHSNGENILLSITEGPMKPIIIHVPADDVDGNDIDGDYEDVEKKIKTKPVKVDFSQCGINWEKMMMGSKIGHQIKVANCINNHEEFKAKENESLEDTYERFTLLLNELTKNKVKKKQLENNVKFLSILRPEWKKHTRRMKQMKDLNEIPLHEVYETLKHNEEEVEEKRAEKKKAEKVSDPIALVGETKNEKKEKIEKKKKKKVSSSSESGYVSDSDDGENCRKPKVRNSQYYQNKLLLASQQEAGVALMVEDEFWLDPSEDESDEKEENAHICLMGKEEKDDKSDDEAVNEVLNLTPKDFITKLETMVVELQNLQNNLKNEKEKVAKKNKKIFKLNTSVISNKELIDSLRKSDSDSKSKVDDFEKMISEFEDEDEAKETENRKNKKKMQLPFNYVKLNDSYLFETPKVLSNDYFVSYSTSEMKAKPAIAKVYVPTSILERKIVDLENVLSDEKLLGDIQQIVFSTVLKNTVFQSKYTKCSTVSKASQSSSDNSDDLFESANDSFNSDDGSMEESDMFDIHSKLPDHSTCLKNDKVLPSVVHIGETSTKVGDSVSVTADYYAHGKKHKK
ncbi:hypothetical protein L6452_15139 [Arctium lappa]|uniref:Uncharacterized protein n=1 Tax=Arctium lappa TaxID=4217 RepID=A0ACB9CMY9_ARCLA|nr:hypothetical protein L6452_15139 [Arctium lappa]